MICILDTFFIDHTNIDINDISIDNSRNGIDSIIEYDNSFQYVRTSVFTKINDIYS